MFNTFLSVYSSIDIDVAQRCYGAHPSNRDNNNNSLPCSRFVLFVFVLVVDVAFAFVVHVHRLWVFKLSSIA